MSLDFEERKREKKARENNYIPPSFFGCFVGKGKEKLQERTGGSYFSFFFFSPPLIHSNHSSLFSVTLVASSFLLLFSFLDLGIPNSFHQDWTLAHSMMGYGCSGVSLMHPTQ